MRATSAFDVTYHMWGPLLLDAGYALLLPNYRGSASRGEAFAAHAKGAMGTVDYDDVMTLTNHAVEEGYADPKRSRNRRLEPWEVSSRISPPCAMGCMARVGSGVVRSLGLALVRLGTA